MGRTSTAVAKIIIAYQIVREIQDIGAGGKTGRSVIHWEYSNIGDICECHLYFDNITTILRLQKSVVGWRYRADEASQWSVAEFG